jgi:hypothetical protein
MNKNDISCTRFSDGKICPLNAIAKKIKTVKIRLKNRKMVFLERVNCKTKPINYLQTSTSICNRLII